MNYVIKNEDLGNILVLCFDLLSNKALIQICRKQAYLFGIVTGFDFKKGIWKSEIYYKDLRKAHQEFLNS